jgi:hypothetical protein
MDKKTPSENHAIEKVLERLKELEARISQLEKIAIIPQGLTSSAKEDDLNTLTVETRESEAEGIESRVGEYGMAWLGNVVLLFGIIFLVQFLKAQGFTVFSSFFGFAAVAGVYLTAYFTREHYPYMSRLFNYNGHLLVFIVTLQLHFITENPLIDNKNAGLILLLVVISPLLYLAYKNRTQMLTGIVLIMIVITAILGNSTVFMLSLMVIIAGVSVFFVHRLGWWKILMLSIFFVYTTFLLWTLNNPIVTHSFKAVETLQFSYIYLFASAVIYSMLALLPGREKTDEQVINVSIILNGLGFSMIMGLLVLRFFKDNYYIPLSIVSVFAVAFSALLQSRGEWKVSAALYALYGFAILSITLAGIYKFPLAFQLLSLQSLLVVSMALWFRSRFIVLMNLVMFISLLLAYFFFPHPLSRIDFTFAIVALVSARVINWQKDRLEIKTEWVRNLYLISGFIMTLVSLYQAVPSQYITLSWTIAAGMFFLLSLLLRIVKYRWLAIATMIVTVFYFFMFDLRQISIGYRIVALLFLAVISLSFSIFYSKRLKKKAS